MSCNCKTNEKILSFYKKYGYKSRVSWREKIHFTTEETIKTLLIIFLTICFAPIIIIVLIIMIIMGKSTFDINKILRFLLRKNE